jgi:hypothetical protein
MLIDSFKSQYICKMQVDYDIFDSFGHFAVSIQNLCDFLFGYSWIEHQLLYQTI